MLSVLQKVTSNVICVVNEEEFPFEDGKSAYEIFKSHYLIKSIYLRANVIVFELEELKESEHWIEAYAKQFGREPSFFE